MPRFAANLTMLFNEVGFVDRFAAAAHAGFTGVEFLFPYEHDRRLLQHAIKEHRLTQVLHNLPAGNWQAGERGIACHPDRTAEVAEGVELLMEPINTRDILNFFLSRPPQALDIINEVGTGNLFLQYDVYHMQIM